MISRFIGILLLVATFGAGVVLRLQPEYQYDVVIFGFMILGGYFGAMMAIDVFNSKNMK